MITIRQETPQEKAVRLDVAASAALDLGPKDRAWVRVLADLLQAQNPGMTIQDARAQIRQSFKAHYAAVSG